MNSVVSYIFGNDNKSVMILFRSAQEREYTMRYLMDEARKRFDEQIGEMMPPEIMRTIFDWSNRHIHFFTTDSSVYGTTPMTAQRDMSGRSIDVFLIQDGIVERDIPNAAAAKELALLRGCTIGKFVWRH